MYCEWLMLVKVIVTISKGHSSLQDVTVPVCPLCNQPVPTRRGNDPNVSVDEHIANDCQSDKARKVTILKGQLH